MRCLSLILVFSLLCLCTFSVSAASVPGQYDVVDLLSTGFFPNGEPKLTKSASSYSFDWEVTSSCSFNYVYMNIYSQDTPSSVKLNGVSGTLVYTGAFYQYKFLMNRRMNSCNVVVAFSSVASRTVSVGYAVGTVSGQAVLSSFILRSKGVNATSFSVSTQSIPFKGTYASVVSNPDLNISQITSKFELTFKSPLASADYVTIHLIVPTMASSYPILTHDAFFEEPSLFLGANSEHTYPLNIISVSSYEDPVRGLSLSSAWHYIVTADVSGYKLDTLDLDVDFSIYGLKNGDTNKYSFGLEVLSCCFGLNPDPGDSDRGFIPWLNARFSDIRSAISSLSTNVSSQFSSLRTSLSSWFSSVGTWISTVGDRIVNAINPSKTPDQQDSQNNVDNQVDSINNFEEQRFLEIDNGSSRLQEDISSGVNSFVPALAFIGHYTTAIGEGIKDYIVVFILPIYIGIFFFVCNRLSGNTHIFRRKGE